MASESKDTELHYVLNTVQNIIRHPEDPWMWFWQKHYREGKCITRIYEIPMKSNLCHLHSRRNLI
jgi:hypothetical protein